MIKSIKVYFICRSIIVVKSIDILKIYRIILVLRHEILIIILGIIPHYNCEFFVGLTGIMITMRNMEYVLHSYFGMILTFNYQCLINCCS